MEKKHGRLACNLFLRRKQYGRRAKEAAERDWRSFEWFFLYDSGVDAGASPAIIKYMKEFMLIPFRERKWKERGYI
jgi:hypothetical protein